MCLEAEGGEAAAAGVETEGNHMLLKWFSVVLISFLGMITTVLMQRLWQCIRRTPQTEETEVVRMRLRQSQKQEHFTSHHSQQIQQMDSPEPPQLEYR